MCNFYSSILPASIFNPFFGYSSVKLKVCNARHYSLQPSYLLYYRGLIRHKDNMQQLPGGMMMISEITACDQAA